MPIKIIISFFQAFTLLSSLPLPYQLPLHKKTSSW